LSRLFSDLQKTGELRQFNHLVRIARNPDIDTCIEEDRFSFQSTFSNEGRDITRGSRTDDGYRGCAYVFHNPNSSFLTACEWKTT